MKTFTLLERDAPVDPIAAIRAARKANELTQAHSLIQAEVRAAGGKVSGVLAYQYAMTLMASKRYDEARDVLALFLALHPDLASAWFLLGQCSEIVGDYGAAEGAFRESVKAHKRKRGQPDIARSYFSLGGNLFRLGRPLEGEDNWRKGLRGECTTPEALFVRSQVLLAFGDYEQGWKDYEARRTLPGWRTGVEAHGAVGILPPEWNGQSRGRVLVYAEQGAGDTCMMSRYLRFVEHASGYAPRVIAGHVMQPLIGYGAVNECEWSAPICSLPRLLDMLEPLAPLMSWLRPQNAKPRAGVCWKGAPAHLNDKDRSSPIDFRDAFQDERWDVVSLQYGEDFKPKDYLETAELMRTLDVVVTVDTSVVHVAGTLGVPTILIPPTGPEWRWGLRSDRTAWYPSVRIVRRKHVDAWPDAIERAREALVDGI